MNEQTKPQTNKQKLLKNNNNNKPQQKNHKTHKRLNQTQESIW